MILATCRAVMCDTAAIISRDGEHSFLTVATFADPRQPHLAAGRVLLRQQSHPGCELSSLTRAGYALGVGREMTAAGLSTPRVVPSESKLCRRVRRCRPPEGCHPLLISSIGPGTLLLSRSDVESSEPQIERPLHLSAIPSDGLRSPPNRNM
jgi:hypothetical protein